MSDKSILEQLERLVGAPFPHVVENGQCTELRLACETAMYHGLIRHHTPAVKQEALRLVARLEGLRRLDLRRNLLSELPQEMASLTQLEQLVLGSNYLGSIPDFIRNFTQLKSLHLGNNDLTQVPEWLGDLPRLEYLALHKNLQLKSIEGLKNARGLKNLNLYFVTLMTLPEFVYEFRSLSTLSLWNTGKFTQGLDAFPNLQFFTLCGTPGLHAFPPGFTRTRSLRMVRLYQNSVETIPDDIGELENLEQISLYQNQISKLPDSMARLKKLTKLNLGWNRLETVPEWLTQLPNLAWLALFENPLLDAQRQNLQRLPFASSTRVDWEWPFSSEPGH